MGIDPTGPSGGSFLAALINSPNLEERWHQGGYVGYGITAVGAFAFLLAIPSIAGAGLLEGLDLVSEGGFEASLLVGMAVAAVSGYLAIAGLLRLITRFGLAPFAAYCIAFGTLALVLL